MPVSANTLFCFAVTLLTAKTARIKSQQSTSKSMNGDHKCTISWPARGNSPPVTTSFGVGSCVIKCKITNAAVRPSKTYSKGLQAIPMKKTCSCQTLQGRELFKYSGSCGNVTEAKSKCWDIYATMMTDRYESEFNRETLKVIHDSKLRGDSTFDYSNCEPNGCTGGECSEYSFPSLWDSRDAAEKKLLAELVKQIAIKGGRGLSAQQQELARTLAKDDIEQAARLAMVDEDSDVQEQIQALFERAGNDEDIIETPKPETPKADPIAIVTAGLEERYGKGFSVAQLKEYYKILVSGTGVSVDHMATVAGLNDDEKIVTEPDLRAFLNPAC
mmetsp:Transcript_92780/g.146678  ORF Transcript_92780/g.146678 Transcript_92780/m.146678 type:complete len:330 (+) Transcript_92780:91-1080(+)